MELVLTAPSTDIVAAVTKEPGIVLLDTEKFDAWYEKLKARAPTDVDVSTKRGRDTLRSFSAEVRAEKAAIDKARLRLTKEWRDMVGQANEAGKLIERRLNMLADEVRRPLTEWEEAEDRRVSECRADIQAFTRAGVVSFEDTAALVRERGADLAQQVIDPARFGEMLDEATAAKEAALTMLGSALVRLEREEAERAELEQLRAAAAERDARERQEREARERQEREAEEARLTEQRRVEAERAAEQRRVEAERAEAERITRAEREAAERAQREAAETARLEREQAERRHAEELAAERRRAEDAERARQAEADRIAAEDAARAAEAERISAEQRRREADQAHRTKVKSAAKAVIMSCGADEETARKVVMAIIANEVPHVRMEF